MAVPRVSIGVPVYNCEAYVGHAIESLLNQTFADLEVVVSDNASTDRTGEICRAYAARDPRVRYFRCDENIGAVRNHNRALDLARGEFFKWNSADDYCAPEFVEKCVAALDRNPKAVMAVSDPVEVNEEGKPLGWITVSDQTLMPVVPEGAPRHVRFRQSIRLDHLCLSIYSIYRTDILRKVAPMGSYADSDRVMIAHCMLYGPCEIVPEPLLFNRDHAGRFSRSYNRFYEGWRERATWMDPANANKKVYPFWREFSELLGAVKRTPMGIGERIQCNWEAMRWATAKGHPRRFWIDATHYPRKALIKKFPGAKIVWNRIWNQKAAPAESAANSQAGQPVGSQSASVSKS